MARYDWPGPPAKTSDDNRALRDLHSRQFWCHIGPDTFEDASAEFRDRLADLADLNLGEIELDRRRWLPLGPSAIVNGQASPIGGAVAGPRVSGRIRDLKRSPDGTRLYAASANGGVWFSGDGGNSWAPLGGMATVPDANARGRAANSLVIGCLHIDFGANADADVVYAGTGEPSHDYGDQGTPGANAGGIGVLKLVRTVTQALADPTGNPWDREAPNLTGAGIYRIVRDPASPDTLVAATTAGLFRRTGAFVSNADWPRLAVAPFDVQTTDKVLATDAAWVPAATAPAAAPARLFVTLVNNGSTARESAVYVSEAGIAGPFAKISLPGYVANNRIALAAVVPLAATPTTHPQVLYALSGGGIDNPRMWRIDVKTARPVAGLPKPLFGGWRLNATRPTQDQSWYDMAIAVDPTNDRRVYLGGSLELHGGQWNASLYRVTVSGTAAANNFAVDFLAANQLTPNLDPTFVGVGIHPDVHIVRVSEDGATVLVGCDGGVFVSTASGAGSSFQSRNTGLAVTECGYVASHPLHAGPVASGTQDNGTIERVGDTIWQCKFMGDGGGVIFHPDAGREAFLVGQYTGTSWQGNGRFHSPMARAAPPPVNTVDEDGSNVSFYSGAAAVAGATPGKARLAMGSYRLWLSDDWDPLAPAAPAMTWRTLPGARDPLANGVNDHDADKLDDTAGHVISVKWLDGGTVSGGTMQGSKLLVLHQRAIARIFQVPGVDKWEREILAWSKKKRITENSDIPANGAPSEKLPMLGAWAEIAPHRATKAGDAEFKGSFYVATTGASIVTNAGVTELDRMDTLWWFDGKDKFFPTGLRNTGTKAPAFAVLCDPETPDTVYVGTGLGVWKGVIDQSAATPTWGWELASIGLPEAFVQDLSIHWNPGAPNGGVKLLRAALQSRGVWELDISTNPGSVGRTFLRVHPLDTRRVLPSSLTNLQDIAAVPTPYPRFLSPDIAIVNPVPASWIGGQPTEADLFSLTPTITQIGPPGSQIQAQQVAASIHPAFVLVHHRHTAPVPANQIRVALLKRRLVEADGDGGGLAVSAAFKAALVSLVANGNAANLDDGWKRADQSEASNPASNPVTVANTVRNPAAAVEARMPRAATFSLDMTGATAGQRYLLLAVVSSSKDALLGLEMPGASVADLVLNSRHLAARVVFI